jgi:hypothetical protein
MKRIPIISCGVLLTALLAGCASSPSLESQAKLIEYRVCLEKQEMISQGVAQLFEEFQTDLIKRGEALVKQGEPDPITGLIPSLEAMKKNCLKYRP